jgi:hypothetical protein
MPVLDVAPKRKLEIWWTCGLPGCSHPTRAGATFHGMLMERGFAQIVMRPFRPGDPMVQVGRYVIRLKA